MFQLRTQMISSGWFPPRDRQLLRWRGMVRWRNRDRLRLRFSAGRLRAGRDGPADPINETARGDGSRRTRSLMTELGARWARTREIWLGFPGPTGLIPDVRKGSRAAVARCGERVSLAPESRPTVSSINHLFSAMCGRLRVGKGNPDVALLVGAAMCSACCCGSHERWP
jgi:hypothetical protein